MSLPKEADIQIPLLKLLIKSNGKSRTQDAIKKLVSYFKEITPQDLELLQPSSISGKSKNKSKLWNNKVMWARQMLVARGAIEGSTRGVWAITAKGREMVDAAERGVPLPPLPRKRYKSLSSVN